MKMTDLNDLDFSNIGSWPAAAKAVMIGFVFLVVCAAAYWFDTKKQLEALEVAERQEQKLRDEVKTKAKKAANLNQLKEQLAEMEKDFSKLRRQLPEDTEVAALLVDISQTGLSAGLEFELFKPAPEIPQEFYAELPINIRVKGTFHEFGEFISGVALLPRIVTLHNIVISPKDGGELVMTAVAKTYRYHDEGSGK